MAKVNNLSQRQAVALASKMRNQMRNAQEKQDTLYSHGGRIAGAALGSWGVGYWMGGLENEYQLNQAAIDAGDMEDPRQLMGIVDLEIVVGVGLLLAGLLGQGVIGSKKGTMAKAGTALSATLEGMGIGAMSGYLYSMGQDAGQTAAEAA